MAASKDSEPLIWYIPEGFYTVPYVTLLAEERRQLGGVGGDAPLYSFGRRRVRREVAGIEHRPEQFGFSRESTLGHVDAGRASAESLVWGF